MNKLISGCLIAIAAIIVLDLTSVFEDASSQAQVIPTTYVTPQNANQIAIQITEGEFYFYDILERSGSQFVGSDSQVRVVYDPTTRQVVVTSIATGQTFYSYYITDQTPVSQPVNQDAIPALW